ncbi:unnamed protein product [Closterium sp. Naga37s-1]|nr:unnamed protein product [Closterium sp. Naga37s-1]
MASTRLKKRQPRVLSWAMDHIHEYGGDPSRILNPPSLIHAPTSSPLSALLRTDRSLPSTKYTKRHCHPQYMKRPGRSHGPYTPCHLPPHHFFSSLRPATDRQVIAIHQVHETSRALSWAMDHIHEYGGDPSRIFLTGHSSGAHVCSMVVWRRLRTGRGSAISGGENPTSVADAVNRATSKEAAKQALRSHLLKSSAFTQLADATPADATPTDATPTDATPADATPTDATPTDATPAAAMLPPAPSLPASSPLQPAQEFTTPPPFSVSSSSYTAAAAATAAVTPSGNASSPSDQEPSSSQEADPLSSDCFSSRFLAPSPPPPLDILRQELGGGVAEAFKYGGEGGRSGDEKTDGRGTGEGAGGAGVGGVGVGIRAKTLVYEDVVHSAFACWAVRGERRGRRDGEGGGGGGVVKGGARDGVSDGEVGGGGKEEEGEWKGGMLMRSKSMRKLSQQEGGDGGAETADGEEREEVAGQVLSSGGASDEMLSEGCLASEGAVLEASGEGAAAAEEKAAEIAEVANGAAAAAPVGVAAEATGGAVAQPGVSLEF